MKTSFVTTLLDEENTIVDLLESLNNQSVLPDEVVIVDGGSTDKTISKIKEFEKSSGSKLKIKLLTAKGNRSIGRNKAIKISSGDIILLSDGGCILHKNWIKNIIKPFGKDVDVVAGYYSGIAKNTFQKSLIPYVLVMPDRVNPATFLPATRSMALKKSVWIKTKGFNEKLSHNEDYEFAKRLKKMNFNIYFARDAVVYWIPRDSLKTVFNMFYRFALGDAQAGIFRPKVIFIFARYLLGVLIILAFLLTKSYSFLLLILLIFIFYILWAIFKNYKYVKKRQAFVYLPLLQFCADFAVLYGTSKGFIKNFSIKKT